MQPPKPKPRVSPKAPARPMQPYGRALAAKPARKYAPMRRMLLWGGFVVAALFWIAFLVVLIGGSEYGKQNLALNAVVVMGMIGVVWTILTPIGFFTLPAPKQRADIVGFILSATGCVSVLAVFAYIIYMIVKSVAR